MKERMEKIKVLIEESYGNQKLNTLSKRLFLHPKYISRIFKENNNERFIKYKRDVQLNYAKNLLENTDDRISEIADKIGYQYSASFIRAFKKETGYTPRQFKRLKKEKLLR